VTYNNTKKAYSFLWDKHADSEKELPEKYHFDFMQEVISEKIVRGDVGLDLGCGCGWDTFIMAKDNPSVKIIGLDMSEGVYKAAKLNSKMENVSIARGAASLIPLKNESCDFVYSFGVLHHMKEYKKAFSEISRVLKKGSPLFLYLYEDHAGNFTKYTAIKIITIIRKATIKIPPRILYFLSCAISPILVLLFSYPAKIFKKYRFTYRLYEAMPFNFGHSLFSLKGDIYDRFAAPIEIRFNQEDLRKIFKEHNFTDPKITKLKTRAGWVVWAYKKG